MASEALAKLQATVNRYSKAVGFQPIAIDGGLGEQTISATQFSVEYAIVHTEGEADPNSTKSTNFRVLQTLSSVLSSGDIGTGLMQNVQTLDTQLTRVADELGLQRPERVSLARQPTGGVVPDPSAFKRKPAPTGFQADLLIAWHKLPTWGQVGIGAVGAIGLLAVIGRKKPKTASKRA